VALASFLTALLAFLVMSASSPIRAEVPGGNSETDTPALQPPASFDRITTLDGKVYEKVSVQRIEPDGLLVEFSPRDNSFGTAKLKFRNLPTDLRERYGYDAARAEAFAASQAQAAQAWNLQNAAWFARKEAAEMEQAQRAQKWRERAEVEANLRLQSELRREEAAEQRRAQTPDYYGGGWWGWGGYGYGSAGYGYATGHHSGHNGHNQQQVIAGEVPSPVSKFMSPMKPLGK
jgi:hypothetical protein